MPIQENRPRTPEVTELPGPNCREGFVETKETSGA